MTDVLTNPAWHALIGAHASHADSRGIARRYDPDVSVFHAIDAFTAEAWEDVARLATNGVVVFLREAPLPPPPDGWRTAFAGEGYQMVRRASSPALPPLPATDPDTGARRDIARPHPRRRRRDGRPRHSHPARSVPPRHDRARRVHRHLPRGRSRRHGRSSLPAPGYCEVSAVCTDPTARRRGYASILTARVADDIAAEGDTPMLHVADDNDSARAAYEQLGFEVSRKCGFAAMQVPRSPR